MTNMMLPCQNHRKSLQVSLALELYC